MLVDSHCHLDMLDLAPFGGGLEGVLETARGEGVTGFLCIAVCLEDYPAMRALIEPFPDVAVSVGVHPEHREAEEPDAARLCALAEDPRVVAIGETGLDYFRAEGDLDWQRARFRRHIEAARACGKPLVVHSRQAKEDTLSLLEAGGADAVGGVLHCFAEDWDMARRAMDLGFYISFSGIVTFKSADTLREVARRMPAERMLVETDAPYLAPVPHRGRPNHPAWVRHTAECIAEVRGETLAQVAEATTRNYQRLFLGG